MISFIKRVSVIGASIGVVEVVGRFEYPGGAEGLAKVMAEKHPLVPVRLEEVEATMGYLDGLSEEDGDALLHFDRDSELITTGRNSVQFRLFVATILPSGFEDMASGPGEESCWSDDVFEPLRGHRQCSRSRFPCPFILVVFMYQFNIYLNGVGGPPPRRGTQGGRPRRKSEGGIDETMELNETFSLPG